MACPTCTHTLAGIGHGMFHCARCGTLKMPNGDFVVPYLVEHCRKFEEGMAAREFAGVASGNFRLDAEEWNATGIRESINPPEERPPI